MDSPPPFKRQFTMTSDSVSSIFEEDQANEEPMDAIHEKMKEFQTARKSQDFKEKAKGWKEIIDDEKNEELMGQFQTCAVQETLVIDRGSESYYVKGYRGSSSRKRKLPNTETKTSEEKIPPTNYDSDHSDISTTGLDEEDLEHLKKQTEKNAQLSADVKIKGCVGDIAAGQTMLKKKSLSRMNELVKGVNDQRLPTFICRQLAEKNRDLIRRCIEKLGRDYCIKILRKTLKIESKGGLLIKNGSRRRTPGGCFFKIIRGDPKNSEILDDIFIVNPTTQNTKQDAQTSGNFSVVQSIFDRIKEKKHPSKIGVNHGLEKQRKAVAERLDLESYSVKRPPPPTTTDPRARNIVTYDDDLFS